MPDLRLLSVKITIAAATCSCSEWRRYEVYQSGANLERLHKIRKKWSYPLKPNHLCLDHTSPQNSSNCDHHTHWWHKCNDLLSQHMPHHADCSLMLQTSIHFLQDHNIPQCCSMKKKKKIVRSPCIRLPSWAQTSEQWIVKIIVTILLKSYQFHFVSHKKSMCLKGQDSHIWECLL